jgi:hypothetical protein
MYQAPGARGGVLELQSGFNTVCDDRASITVPIV